MGILQARILEWVSSPPPGDLPHPGIKPRSPSLQADSLQSKPPGKPSNDYIYIYIYVYIYAAHKVKIRLRCRRPRFDSCVRKIHSRRERLLLLSCFSSVRLCVTPETAAYQAPLSLDSPGKNTGVGCHFLLQCMRVKSESEVARSCPTLRDPMDCSPPGSSVHVIFQATHSNILGLPW